MYQLIEHSYANKYSLRLSVRFFSHLDLIYDCYTAVMAHKGLLAKNWQHSRQPDLDRHSEDWDVTHVIRWPTQATEHDKNYLHLEAALYDYGFQHEFFNRAKTKQYIRFRSPGLLRDVLTAADVMLEEAFKDAGVEQVLVTFPRVITYQNMPEVMEEIRLSPDLEIPF